MPRSTGTTGSLSLDWLDDAPEGDGFAAMAVDDLGCTLLVKVRYARLGHIGDLVALLAPGRSPGQVLQAGEPLVERLLVP